MPFQISASFWTSPSDQHRLLVPDIPGSTESDIEAAFPFFRIGVDLPLSVAESASAVLETCDASPISPVLLGKESLSCF